MTGQGLEQMSLTRIYSLFPGSYLENHMKSLNSLPSGFIAICMQPPLADERLLEGPCCLHELGDCDNNTVTFFLVTLSSEPLEAMQEDRGVKKSMILGREEGESSFGLCDILESVPAGGGESVLCRHI